MNGPNPSYELEAVHLGHIGVREHQSYAVDILNRLETFTAIASLDDATPGNTELAKFGDEYLPDGLRVLADSKPSHRRLESSCCSRHADFAECQERPSHLANSLRLLLPDQPQACNARQWHLG